VAPAAALPVPKPPEDQVEPGAARISDVGSGSALGDETAHNYPKRSTQREPITGLPPKRPNSVPKLGRVQLLEPLVLPQHPLPLIGRIEIL
jgi:hypothetical protein